MIGSAVVGHCAAWQPTIVIILEGFPPNPLLFLADTIPSTPVLYCIYRMYLLARRKMLMVVLMVVFVVDSEVAVALL
jgi:hypothetical protein